MAQPLRSEFGSNVVTICLGEQCTVAAAPATEKCRRIQ